MSKSSDGKTRPIITNLEKGYITTPTGELLYVNISGQGKANYNQDGYDYVASVLLKGDDAKQYKEEIDAFIDDNKPKKAKIRKDHKPYKTHKDNDKIPKGSILVGFKTGTTFDSGDTAHIGVFNGKLKPVSLPDGTKIGNGSMGRISGKLSVGTNKSETEWWLTHWLSNLQIGTFVEYEENSGFDEMDDSEFDNFEDVKADKKKSKKSDDDEKPKKDKKKKKKNKDAE